MVIFLNLTSSSYFGQNTNGKFDLRSAGLAMETVIVTTVYSCVYSVHERLTSLKRQCHEIFDLCFFFIKQLPRGP
jgi:hypothetical protein